MVKNIFLKLLIIPSFFTFISCDSVQSDSGYGSISGKLLHPDTNVCIRIISPGSVDTVSLDPVLQTFTLSGIKYDNYILQVEADGYGTFERKLVLNKPLLTCHEIILCRTPVQVAYLFPSSCLNLDLEYFNFRELQVNDSGFNPEITFNQDMDTASANKAITILPDSIGVQMEWYLEKSLVFHFPYWKLATVDTIRITIKKEALNRWGDPLDFDYSIFYPVDTNYVRANLLKSNH